MTTAITPREGMADTALIEKVIIEGDLANLSPAERVSYYMQVCNSLGLNWSTKPFDYIRLNDKLTLYARRDATDQIRRLQKVNIEIVSREVVEGVYVVTAKATMPDGRTDESTGAVPLSKADGDWKTSQSGKKYFAPNGNTSLLTPEERANGMMKAETKSKRRVTLSIVGLGWLDESEIETVRDARRVNVTPEGEIIDVHPAPAPRQTRPEPRIKAEPPPGKSDNGPGPEADIPTFKDVGALMTWAHNVTKLDQKGMLSILGVDNPLLILDKYGTFAKAAEALLKNVPPPAPPAEGEAQNE
ncbi:MAG: hypothetical protein Q7O66_16850 [Dehalococcoidia bacterium]|nr:hypothetical protein [Dehalococcoidia bacterium]